MYLQTIVCYRELYLHVVGQAGAVVVVVVAWVHLLVVVVGAGVGHVVGEGFLPNILHNDLAAEAAVEGQKQDQQ